MFLQESVQSPSCLTHSEPLQACLVSTQGLLLITISTPLFSSLSYSAQSGVSRNSERNKRTLKTDQAHTKILTLLAERRLSPHAALPKGTATQAGESERVPGATAARSHRASRRTGREARPCCAAAPVPPQPHPLQAPQYSRAAAALPPRPTDLLEWKRCSGSVR